MPANTPVRVDDQNGPKIREIARKKVERIAASSEIFNPKKELCLPRFNATELELGRILGKGGFCTVSEIRHVSIDSRLERWDSSFRDESHLKNRTHICRNTLNSRGEARYAVKQLSEDTRLDAHQYLKGVVDLATEMKYLAVLDHPHIIKMKAVSDRDAFENRGFFIVLDRLYDTLERRCFIWRRRKNGINALMSKVGASKKRDGLLLDRMGVAFDLCSALLYMHKKNIIYRDLKPENIGFDVQDKVKIFDLGLSTEVKRDDMLEDGTWELTGLTGSLRYMAPEVVLWKPYNFSADVYSFGILLWQILSLKVPFEGLNVKTHNEFVVQKGSRPQIKNSWPASWGSILHKCWHSDLKRRSRLEDIVAMVHGEVVQIGGDSILKDRFSEVTESIHSADMGEEDQFLHHTEGDEELNRTIRSDMNGINQF